MQGKVLKKFGSDSNEIEIRDTLLITQPLRDLIMLEKLSRCGEERRALNKMPKFFIDLYVIQCD